MPMHILEGVSRNGYFAYQIARGKVIDEFATIAFWAAAVEAAHVVHERMLKMESAECRDVDQPAQMAQDADSDEMGCGDNPFKAPATIQARL